jgi:serine/threonine protein kinase/predicted ATPase/class 3 adenylate cyclase
MDQPVIRGGGKDLLAACEAARLAGNRLWIEQFLARLPGDRRSVLLPDLLAAEIECRLVAGEMPSPEEYQRRFPGHADTVQAIYQRVLAARHVAPSGLALQNLPTVPDHNQAALLSDPSLSSIHAADGQERTSDFVGQRAAAGPPPPSTPEEAAAAPPASQQAPPPRPHTALPKTPGPCSAGPPAAGEGMPAAFGRYQLLGLLGRGGFGTVYLGYDGQLDRRVAVKVPYSDQGRSPEGVQFLLQEARRLARLKHPGIVAVHDVGFEGDQFYIVSDFIDGTSLSDWLRSHRPSYAEAAQVAAAVADALACAHRQRIVHRDVKPGNILLAGDLEPVLVDFGLALTDGEGAGQRHMVMGTPSYMSPEQASGEGHRIDGRTDIYSLGVVFYRMLCGRPPFVAPMTSELLRQVCEDDPQPPRQLDPNIPRELERICLKAMARRISDRYTTASDLSEDLLEFLETSRTSAPPVPPSASNAPAEPAAGPGRRCLECGLENPPEFRFCGGCGKSMFVRATPSPVTPAAPAAENERPVPPAPPRDEPDSSAAPTLPLGAKQSHEENTPSGSRPPAAERRPLTALFCRLDPQFLFEDIDPEDISGILPGFQEACVEVAERAGGHVAQRAGEDLLVYFGYPQATEDASRQAVRTGLALVETVARLAASFSLHPPPTQAPSEDSGGLLHGGFRSGMSGSSLIQVGIRVGIHTGWVVTGEVPPVRVHREPERPAGRSGGERGLAGDWALLSEPRSVATRLHDLAEPNTVVLSVATHRLVQGFFECSSLGTHALKGTTRRLEVFQALRECEVSNRIEVAGPTGLTPLVGRDRELGLLLDRWEQVQEGTGQVVLLSGEPGIGKSRLLHEVKQQVCHGKQDTPVPRTPLVLEWRGAPQYQNSDFYPVRDFLERYLNLRREQAVETRRARLEEMLSGLGFSLPEAVPLFAPLLGLPGSERYPVPALSPQKLRQKTLEALLDWLRRQAGRQPLLLLVEDLHWADRSTLGLLDLILEQVTSESMFLLFTCRPEFRSPWGDCHFLTRVALNRLTRKQVVDLIERRTGCSGLPPEVGEQVLARTDGVPLFVEEMVKMMLEAGLLRQQNGHFELQGSLPARAIPDTLQDLLMTRLDRLGEARGIAQIGAALGREFTHELIQAVVGCSPPRGGLDERASGASDSLPQCDATTLEEGLSRLIEAELLFRKGRPPEVSYLFKHALIQDAAYQSLPRSTRQRVHQRIAETYLSSFTETVEAHPELLAHHFTEAGLITDAIGWWEKAGLVARERSANAEAIGHLSRGLELLSGLKESPENDRQELRIQIPLGAALLSTRGYAAPEVGLTYSRARALCEKLGETDDLFHILWGMWAWLVVRDELDLCMEMAPEILRLAEAQQDDGMLMEALFVPGLTQTYRGEFEEARRHCERGAALAETERCRHHARRTGQNCAVTIRCYWGLALWHLGYSDQALRCCQEMVALARQLNHPFTLCYAYHHAAWLHQHCRLGNEARAFAQAEIDLAAEQEFAFWAATGRLYRGAALLLLGEHAQGLADVRQGLEAYRATGAELALPYYLSFLAQGQARVGQTEEGLQTLDSALVAADRRHDYFHLAEIHRLRGEWLLDRDPAQAETAFLRSLETARGQGGRSWELRAALSLGRLWHARGRTAEARDLVAGIYATFTEGFGTPDLVDARTWIKG